MAGYEDKDDFAKGVRAAREFAEPSIKNRREYAKRVLGLDSDSSGERLEAGDLGKRKDNADARYQVARRVIEVTDCPPEIFGLSDLPPHVDLESRLQEIEDALRAAADVGDQLATAVETQGASIEEMLARIERLEHGQASSDK